MAARNVFWKEVSSPCRDKRFLHTQTHPLARGADPPPRRLLRRPESRFLIRRMLFSLLAAHSRWDTLCRAPKWALKFYPCAPARIEIERGSRRMLLSSLWLASKNAVAVKPTSKKWMELLLTERNFPGNFLPGVEDLSKNFCLQHRVGGIHKSSLIIWSQTLARRKSVSNAVGVAPAPSDTYGISI